MKKIQVKWSDTEYYIAIIHVEDDFDITDEEAVYDHISSAESMQIPVIKDPDGYLGHEVTSVVEVKEVG